MRASKTLTSLHDLRRAHFKGNHGSNGKAVNRGGVTGGHKNFSVPLGTEVWVLNDDETIGEKVADLDEEGQSYTVAKGGAGAKGNAEKKY